MVSHKFSETDRLQPQEERGQVIVLVVLMLIVLLGMAALVIDVGYAYYASRTLQGSADAAALAAAQELPDAARATAVAHQFSSSDGGKNEHFDINDVTTTVTTKCVASLGGCNPVNAVVVLESAPTKTFFAGLLGIDTFTIKARATASMRGGKPKPAHVIIIFDRTNSMNQPCTAGGTKVTCARNGINAFLNQMDPNYDKVGLLAFPPGAGGSPCTFTPKSTDGPTTDYDRYPNGYLQVGLSTDYKTSATSPLNPTSLLVSTVGCIRANGTTATSQAIDKAQQTLAANHDPEAQDVIIFFTDGEANYGACTIASTQVCTNNTSPTRTRPCQSAVNAADNAALTGTWVYGIAYDTATTSCWGWRATGSDSNGNPCAKLNGYQFRCAEQPAITATAMVAGVASDPTRFFNQPNPGDLTAIFKRIATDLTGARLLDDDAT